jgi:hypothetical protein
MKRPAVNKPRATSPKPFGFEILMRQGTERFARQFDQRFNTMAEEVLNEALAAIVLALTTPRPQPIPIPARAVRRGRNPR